MSPSSRDTQPLVSVIIPAADAAGTVAEAVESALNQSLVGEVVVAVADEATKQAVAIFDDPRVRAIDNDSGTTPAALNRALEEVKGEIVVRCDAHATLPPGFVERAVTTLRETGAVNVGGRQVPHGRTFFERAVALAMISPIGAGDARYRIGGDPGPVDTVYLGVFRREALEAVDGFDETLQRNQDYEMNWRLRQAGGVVWFDPRLEVGYRPRGSLSRLWRQYFEYGYWKRVVLSRHPGSLQLRQLAPPALIVGLAASGVVSVLDWRLAAALPGVYLATTVGAAAYDGIRTRDPAASLEPAALTTMHLAWGIGFMAALLSGRWREHPHRAK